MVLNKASRSRRSSLVTYSNTDSIITDQFRVIRSNIEFSSSKQKTTILITSTKEKEGKSTIAANLAISMAQQKEKVLLIDTNLREPVIDKLFVIPNGIGLANVLEGNASLKQSIFHSDIKKLDILTGGVHKSNPTELLASEEMEHLLEEVSSQYDKVIIDAPAVLTTTDSRILANICEGVLLVVNRGKIEMEKVKEAKRILEVSHANLLGIIFNEK